MKKIEVPAVFNILFVKIVLNNDELINSSESQHVAILR